MWLLLACVERAPKPDEGGSDTDASDTGVADSGGETGADTAGIGAACIPEVPLCEGAGCALSFDLRTAHVSGTVSLDGADLAEEDWHVVFAGPTAGWKVSSDPGRADGWGATHDVDLFLVPAIGGTWSGQVPLGNWDVYLARVDRTGVLERVPIGPATLAGDTPLDLAGTRQAVDLSLAVGGVALGASPVTDMWTLTLTEAATGARRVVESGEPDGLAVRLAPGTWAAALDLHTFELGAAEGAWDLGVFVVAEDGAVALDADAVTVSGAVSSEGAPYWEEGDGQPELWAIYLRDSLTGAAWEVWINDEDTWSARVPPGTYDIELRGRVHTTVHEGVELDADATVDIDVRAHTLSGTAAYAGVPVPAGSWGVWLVHTGTGDLVNASIYGSSWAANVPEGVWDIWMAYATYDVEPHANVRVANGVVVAADGTLDLDVVDYAVSGTLTFSGGAPPNRWGDRDWGLTFEDPATGTTLSGVFESGAPWRVRLPAGTYDVSMWWFDEAAYEFPTTRAAEGIVVTADTTLDLAVHAEPVQVSLTLDGAALPTDGNATAMFLVWEEVETGARNLQRFTAGDAELLLPHGAYTFWGMVEALEGEGTEHVAVIGTCLVVE
ncbi:MAG: hypothetical protein Q8P41_05390 [Pseudomonadota bacterium]|nr:hypothetical protein [Pseudomonadota bacterium]